MMLVKFTAEDGSPILINPEHIASLAANRGDDTLIHGTRIVLAGSGEILIGETVRQVSEKLGSDALGAD